MDKQIGRTRNLKGCILKKSWYVRHSQFVLNIGFLFDLFFNQLRRSLICSALNLKVKIEIISPIVQLRPLTGQFSVASAELGSAVYEQSNHPSREQIVYQEALFRLSKLTGYICTSACQF